MQMTVKCVLEVGDTVKDKSNSIRFVEILPSWGVLLSPVLPGYAYAKYMYCYWNHAITSNWRYQINTWHIAAYNTTNWWKNPCLVPGNSRTYNKLLTDLQLTLPKTVWKFIQKSCIIFTSNTQFKIGNSTNEHITFNDSRLYKYGS